MTGDMTLSIVLGSTLSGVVRAGEIVWCDSVRQRKGLGEGLSHRRKGLETEDDKAEPWMLQALCLCGPWFHRPHPFPEESHFSSSNLHANDSEILMSNFDLSPERYVQMPALHYGFHLKFNTSKNWTRTFPPKHTLSLLFLMTMQVPKIQMFLTQEPSCPTPPPSKDFLKPPPPPFPLRLPQFKPSVSWTIANIFWLLLLSSFFSFRSIFYPVIRVSVFQASLIRNSQSACYKCRLPGLCLDILSLWVWTEAYESVFIT